MINFESPSIVSNFEIEFMMSHQIQHYCYVAVFMLGLFIHRWVHLSLSLSLAMLRVELDGKRNEKTRQYSAT